MNQSRKVLVLGATGALGQYLVPRLAAMGYRVDGVAIDDKTDNIPNVNYIKANAKDRAVLQQLLANSYDGIVDFMIYNSGELPYFLPLLPEHTDHYIYLSSYRVYDNKEHPVRETSPRLIDSSDDLLLRNSDDYSIYKARGENVLSPEQLDDHPSRHHLFVYALSTGDSGSRKYCRQSFRRQKGGSSGTGKKCSGDHELGGRCRANDCGTPVQ